MKKQITLLPLVLSSLFVVSGCNASSDAKKVEVKKAVAEADTSTKTIKAVAKSEEKHNHSHGDDQAAHKMAEDNSAATKFVEGKHYVEIFPEMSTDAAPGKVEVVEIMWLGCPHCYTLEPTMLEYKKSHPDYVEFKQVPAMLNPTWAADANTYYIAEMLDPKGEKGLITKIFQAIHEQKRRLNNPDAAKRFLLQQGITEEEYNNTANSLALKVKLKRAQEISAASQAQSVPSVIVNGKYRTSPYMAGGEDKLMKVIDMLTRKEKK